MFENFFMVHFILMIIYLNILKWSKLFQRTEDLLYSNIGERRMCSFLTGFRNLCFFITMVAAPDSVQIIKHYNLQNKRIVGCNKVWSSQLELILYVFLSLHHQCFAIKQALPHCWWAGSSSLLMRRLHHTADEPAPPHCWWVGFITLNAGRLHQVANV